ncbi:hypothetical protein ACRAWG_02830 [Methylobacterium sp. P31]
MAGRHGGRRLGAGRKPSPVIEPEPVIKLAEVLQRLPTSAMDRQRRCAVALAAYGADDREIAVALAIESAVVADVFAADVQLGRMVLRSNLRAEVIRAGLGRGRPFSASAAAMALSWLTPPAERR